MSSTEEKIAALRQQYMDDAGDLFEHWLTYCESPIERLLLAKMVADGWHMPSPSDWSDLVSRIADTTGSTSRNGDFLLMTSCFDHIHAAVQLVIGSYRVDFAFFAPNERLVVELDGHDFHERTREQARRDKRRDRDLVAGGWKVLRYTGSEIYSNVDLAYDEICGHLNRAYDRTA